MKALKRLTNDPTDDTSTSKQRMKNPTIHYLLNELPNYLGVVPLSSVADFTALLKSINTGIKPLDSLLHKLSVKINSKGFLIVGDGHNVYVNVFQQLLKTGSLTELFQFTNPREIENIKKKDFDAFYKLVGDNVERRYHDLLIQIRNSRMAFPHLAIKLDEYKKLSAEEKDELHDEINGIESMLDAKKPNATIPLIIGSISTSDNWILQETERRNGCHALSLINGKVLSCKILQNSCQNQMGQACSENSNYYNITLLAMHLINNDNDNEMKQNFATALGVRAEALKEQFTTLFETKYPIIYEFINNWSNKPQILPCNVQTEGFYKISMQQCRMCDLFADPTSIEYIDPRQIPKNTTLKCVDSPTLIDVIVDVEMSTGIKLLPYNNDVYKVASTHLNNRNLVKREDKAPETDPEPNAPQKPQQPDKPPITAEHQEAPRPKSYKPLYWIALAIIIYIIIVVAVVFTHFKTQSKQKRSNAYIR